MMRRESAVDDLLHAVHHLSRLAAEDPPESEVHLDIGDLAALTAGTLFESECTRVENHLLVCRACRDAAAALHREYEAGAVPILMRRRAPTGPSRPSIGEKITRRWSPVIIALIVFAAVLMVTAGRSLLFGEKDVSIPQRRFVIARVGSPDVRTPNDALRPATPGEWLESGEKLVLEIGDLVTVVSEDGTLRELSMGADEPVVESPLLADIFAAAMARWTSRRNELARDPAVGEAAEGLVFLHPIGPTMDARPAILWTDADDEEQYVVRMHLVGGGKVFETRVAGGRCDFPSHEVSLRPGSEYVVRVEPGDTRRAGVEARFVVIDGDHRVRVETELEDLSRLIGRESNVLRAELLWERGLLGEARRELERLRSRDGRNLYVLARLKLLLSDLGLVHEESRIHRILMKRGLPR